jgi:hypothetical protein
MSLKLGARRSRAEFFNPLGRTSMKTKLFLAVSALSLLASANTFANATADVTCHFTKDVYGNDEDTTLTFSVSQGDDSVYDVALVRDGKAYATAKANPKVAPDADYHPRNTQNKNRNQYKLVAKRGLPCTPNFLIDRADVTRAAKSPTVQLRLQCTDNQGLMTAKCQENAAR